MRRILAPFLIFTALLGGFAVAELTQSRPVGGVVMVVFALAAAVLLVRSSGLLRTVLVGVVFIFLFMVSHSLAGFIGPWPSAVAVATLAALMAFFAERKVSHG